MAKKRIKKQESGIKKKTPPKAKKSAINKPSKLSQPSKPTNPSKPSQPKKRKPSRYNQLQKILSEYGKQKEVKFGKLFNKKVKELALRTTHTTIDPKTKKVTKVTYDSPEWIRQHIELLYTEYLEPRDITTKFPDRFQWFFYNKEFNEFIFNGIIIRIFFKDNIIDEPFEYEGYSDDVIQWWRTSGLYQHLRKYWNDSPEIAQFNIEDTDGSTYANYVCIMGEVATLEEMDKEHIEEKTPADVEEKKKQLAITAIKDKLTKLLDKVKASQQAKKEAEAKAGVSDKEKETAKAQEKTFEKEIEFEKQKQQTEIEKQKTKDKEIELINKRLELMQQLKALGMTGEQIIDYLNKLG